jgi:hypothetical protein
MKLKIPFIGQKSTGSFLGGIMEAYQRSSVVVNAVQFLAVIVMLFTTSAEPFLAKYLPWVTFPIYMMVAVVGIGCLMVVAYILAIPSAYSFFNNQVWKHNNPQKRKLERIDRRQQLILDKLGIKDEVDDEE